MLNPYKQTHPDIKPIPRESKTVRRSSFDDQPRPTALGLFQIPVIRALFFSGFFLCYTSTAYDVLLVLFAFTPVSLGGLGFDPERIGYVLAAAGIGGTFVSLVALPWLLRRWSPGHVYACAMALWPFAFLVLPLTNWAARLSSAIQGQAHERSEALIWVGIVLSLVMSKAACAAFGYVAHAYCCPSALFIHTFTRLGATCFSSGSLRPAPIRSVRQTGSSTSRSTFRGESAPGSRVPYSRLRWSITCWMVHYGFGL